MPHRVRDTRKKRMQDDTLPTVAQSALRGLACKCPRCGKGKLYQGFLTLRPACENCGLDYAFIDSGDGPGVLLIHDGRARRGGRPPGRRNKTPAAVLASRRPLAAADSPDYLVTAALD